MKQLEFFKDLGIEKPKKRQKKRAVCAITAETRKESYEKIEKTSLHRAVLEVLENENLTAREIAVALFDRGILSFPARAIISPRITELAQMGKIEIVNKKYDDVTERNVAVFAIKK